MATLNVGGTPATEQQRKELREGLGLGEALQLSDGLLTRGGVLLTEAEKTAIRADLSVAGADGADGVDGASAYQIAVTNGFVGDEAAWLLSLKGADGADGTDGASAYQIAVTNGFVGDEASWLLSLKGADGESGGSPVDTSVLVSKSGDTMTGPLGLLSDQTGSNARRADETIWKVGGAARIPSWTTAGRPATPSVGDTGFNTTLVCNETWDGTYWISSSIQRSPSLALPGTTDLSGIPGYARRIGVHLKGASGSSTGNLLIRVGHAGGVVSSGYSSNSAIVSAGGYGAITSSVGFALFSNAASASISGTLYLDSVDGLTWVASGALSGAEPNGLSIGGSITLPALLDRLQIAYTTGTPDAGSWHVTWSK